MYHQVSPNTPSPPKTTTTIKTNPDQPYLQLINNHIYSCVGIHTKNLFHLIHISYSQNHIHAHMLTQNSYPLIVVYSHDDTENILCRNSRLLSDKLSLAITQAFIHPTLYSNIYTPFPTHLNDILTLAITHTFIPPTAI